MKCTFKEADFRPAWLAIQWAKTGDYWDNFENDDWPSLILRIEASNGTLSFVSPFGQAQCPAQIECPGVFFVNIREFVATTTRHSWDEEPLELEADDDHFLYSGMTVLGENADMALFDDPATAPQTWQPSEDDEEEEDDDFEEDETATDTEGLEDPA